MAARIPGGLFWTAYTMLHVAVGCCADPDLGRTRQLRTVDARRAIRARRQSSWRSSRVARRPGRRSLRNCEPSIVGVAHGPRGDSIVTDKLGGWLANQRGRHIGRGYPAGTRPPMSQPHAPASGPLRDMRPNDSPQHLKRRGAGQDTTHLIRLGRAVTLAEVAFTRDHEPMPFEHWPGCQAGEGGQCW